MDENLLLSFCSLLTNCFIYLLFLYLCLVIYLCDLVVFCSKDILQVWRWYFTLGPQFSDGSKKSHWLSIWLAFYCCFKDGNDWNVTTTLHIRTEMGSSYIKFLEDSLFILFRIIFVFSDINLQSSHFLVRTSDPGMIVKSLLTPLF